MLGKVRRGFASVEAFMGLAVLAGLVFAVAWIGFIGWMLWLLVHWLLTK